MDVLCDALRLICNCFDNAEFFSVWKVSAFEEVADTDTIIVLVKLHVYN